MIENSFDVFWFYLPSLIFSIAVLIAVLFGCYVAYKILKKYC